MESSNGTKSMNLNSTQEPGKKVMGAKTGGGGIIDLENKVESEASEEM